MTPDSENSNQNSGLWYGWVVLALIFIVMSVMVGMRNSIGFFFKSIAGEFGWNRAQTAGAYSIGMLVQAFCSPLFGRLGEHWSLRWMIALGIFFGGAAFLIGSSIDSLFQFYLMYALLNIGFAASTFVPQVQILSNWFVKRRGLAMGVSNAGQGFAAVLILAVPLLIRLVGWRHSYLVLAGFTLVFIFPTAALLLRDRPADRGTVADAPFLDKAASPAALAGKTKASQARTGPPVEPLFFQKILSLRFVLIALIYAAIAYVMVGTTVHIVPHATDQGFTPKTSALLFLLWGICMIGGNLFSIVSDRFGRQRTYAAGAALGVIACVLLAYYVAGMTPAVFYLATVLSGLGLGLIRPTASALLADHFAGPGFGKLNGSAMTIFALSGALGAYVTGHLFDLAASYRHAFLLLAVVNVAGAAAAASIGKVRR